MKKTLSIFVQLIFAPFILFSQSIQENQKPKLIIGIVVDQMRADYPARFGNKFGKEGFNKLLSGGNYFSECYYNYVPTETAPGHASIYTGATPSVHGIVSNEWYHSAEKRVLSSVQGLTDTSPKSPGKLMSETITDRFKDSFKGSRVYSISLKDRGAILPGGKNADAAFWYDDASGRWISSSYYNSEKTKKKWIADFNAKNFPKQFLNAGWKLRENHVFEYKDASTYEGLLGKNSKPEFPYSFDSTAYSDLKYTSWGNRLTLMFAEVLLTHEKPGQNAEPDFLCISFSSTDYAGHRFGINSVELEQIYLDLDDDIANLLRLLDKQVGKNNYLLFLTSDHGAVSNPEYLKSIGNAGGIILNDEWKRTLKNLAGDVPGKDSLLMTASQEIKFNDELIKIRNLNRDSLTAAFTDFLHRQPGIGTVLTASELSAAKFNYGIRHMMQNGFNESRSGDILFEMKPNWIIWYSEKGTTHGTPYEYDTHVPLIFYGWKIKQGNNSERVNITDIAPTISTLLNIEFPNGCTGKSLEKFLK